MLRKSFDKINVQGYRDGTVIKYEHAHKHKINDHAHKSPVCDRNKQMNVSSRFVGIFLVQGTGTYIALYGHASSLKGVLLLIILSNLGLTTWRGVVLEHPKHPPPPIHPCDISSKDVF